MKDGTSQLYNRKCFGYRKNENGDLEICPEEAEIVRLIFELYLQGSSILSIIKELESKEILTPSGKRKWCNQSVVKILTNEKYIGNVLLKKRIPMVFRIGNERKIPVRSTSTSQNKFIQKLFQKRYLTLFRKNVKEEAM
ncbi:MAG: recombinase family protein [Ruminococcus flavefaciens]|nr:recombinase family protein [Ruminococcus flavefaciens]MCM1362415.1 recombinase family protein [Clostridiales bacterium]